MSHNEGRSQTGCAWLWIQSSICEAGGLNKDGLLHLPPLMLQLLKREKKAQGGCICAVSAWLLLQTVLIQWSHISSSVSPPLQSIWRQVTCSTSLKHNAKCCLISDRAGVTLMFYPFSNTLVEMRQCGARRLLGGGGALQVLALPAWLEGLSFRQKVKRGFIWKGIRLHRF